MTDPLDDLAAAAQAHADRKRTLRTSGNTPPPVLPAAHAYMPDNRRAHTTPSTTTRLSNPAEAGFKFALGASAAALTVAIAVTLAIILAIILGCAGCLTMAGLAGKATQQTPPPVRTR